MRNNRTKLTDDPYLGPYLNDLKRRNGNFLRVKERIGGDLNKFANAHEYYGMHFRNGRWVFREWAPNAVRICLIGEFSGWSESSEFCLNRINDKGDWEIRLAPEVLSHGMLYKLRVWWNGGSGERIPAYARRVVQDPDTKIFSAQVWKPPENYKWANQPPDGPQSAPLIYEAHAGMASEEESIGSYVHFRDMIVPRIRDAGYNTIQLMAIQEHPYYGSFGYQVSSFFAASSRFGTPEELKSLIDRAHGSGLRVIIDIVHSHAVANEVEGLSRFDGTEYQYFHSGPRGTHPAWGSRLFDYGRIEVIHFLLSNLKYWIDEYNLDGFRFDGITSMLYFHHGLGPGFNSYEDYFNDTVDEDAVNYLTLANELLHTIRPKAISVAEDISGMPGLASPVKEKGCGFDYRMAMGVTDYWFRLCKDVRDEDWNMQGLWHALTDSRSDEQTVSYVECHDQALVGGKSLIFEMADAAMYTDMSKSSHNIIIDRALAQHKMSRLATLAACGNGYLNFMGNEFGHPEWVDFPRDGNNWSMKYCRRQWSLRDNTGLHYDSLAKFDKAMLSLCAENNLISGFSPEAMHIHGQDKVIAFKRGSFLFLFNFHPAESYADYGVHIQFPRKYVLALDTDEKRFSGFGRLKPEQEYLPHGYKDGNGNSYSVVKVYLPARCGIVLREKSG